MSAQELKRLQVVKTELEGELVQLTESVKNLQKQVTDKTGKLQKIKNEIITLTNNKPIVSEHALLRYVERVHNIKLSAIVDEILSPKNIEIIEIVRSGKIQCEKYRIIVKNKVVTTIET